VHTITLEYKYLELEPLGFVFMIFFALVMLIQMIGMILHRIMTLGHIISSTNFRLVNPNPHCLGNSKAFFV
jgi:chitin synthase